MSGGDDAERTHEPTDKKLDDALKRGDVPTSAEMRHAVMFGAMLFLFGAAGRYAFVNLAQLGSDVLGGADQVQFSPDSARHFSAWVGGRFVRAMLPVLGVLMFAACIVPFVQGRFTWSPSRLAPKLSKLSPMVGAGRLFSKRALIEFAKTIVKSAAIVLIATITLQQAAAGLEQLVGSSAESLIRFLAGVSFDILKTVALFAGAIALADLVYQRHSYLKRMRMTLHEMREEMRQSEGDPKVKAQIRAIRMARSRRRMMASVPTATVVVTNPTHYAVALKYDHSAQSPPIVVAKGADAVALRIRAVAAEAGVPVMESPPLARALYADVDIGGSILVEHYKAVAEIINFVTRLRKTL